MKKIISLLLSVAMVVCGVMSSGITALADEEIYAPDTIYGLEISQISQTSVKVKWYDSSWNDVHAEKYQISQYFASTDTYKVLATISAKKNCEDYTYTVANLKKATKYTLVLRGYNEAADGTRYYSDYSDKLYVSTAPKDATLKSVKYTQKGKMKVTWSRVDGVSGYLIEYCTNSKFKNDGTTCYVKASKDATSKTITGLAQKKYYVRIRSYITYKSICFCSDYSATKSTTIKKGMSVKEIINTMTTSKEGGKYVKKFTAGGVDTTKYSSPYTRFKAIYDWHSKHNTDYGWNCLGCNSNFAACVAELFKDQKKYESFIYLACDNFKNSNGSVVMHKWCVIYLAGVPYIFDPRLQGYTGQKTGTTYFAVEPDSSLGKRYLFDGWFSYFPTTFEDCSTYDRYMPYFTFPFVDSVKKPKAPTVTATAKKGALKLDWKKISYVNGYEIQYSTSSSFSGAKSIDVAADKLTATISNLKSGKTYYIRMRAYKKIGTSKINGTWSTAAKVKTK